MNLCWLRFAFWCFCSLVYVQVAFCQSLAVRSTEVDGKRLLAVDDVARVLGYESKFVESQNLVVFCRNDETALCIPVRLGRTDLTEKQGLAFVSASLIEDALSVVSRENNGVLILEPREQKVGRQEETPQYASAFPRGRGFQKGDTLPDIPLVDLDGKEVRFSTFLGKRYILYCWASW